MCVEIKHAAAIITISRIFGALALLLVTPMSVPFFVIYSICGLSDILDGYVARKTNTAGRQGEILDSAADFIFIIAALYVFVPLLAWEAWMLYWIGAIAFIRLLSLGIGFLKYRAFSFLHTYANKATGVMLLFFPFIYRIADLSAAAIIICCAASLSALEELTITVYANELNRNISGIFGLRKRRIT